MNLQNVFDYDEHENLPVDSAMIARVDKGIIGLDMLFEVLFRCLVLPGYFGFNWNALSDSLRDLHWVKEHTIVLIHGDLPELEDADLYQYLDVLRESVLDWHGESEHSFRVRFPEDARTRIEEIWTAGSA